MNAVLRVYARSGRWPALAWIVGLVGAFAATALSLHASYGTPAKIAEYARGVQVTATVAMNGLPIGTDTIGGVVGYEFGFLATIAYPLMGMLLAARWTRHEEDDGRLELLRAGTVGRGTPPAVALLLCLAVAVVTAGGMALALVAIGVPTSAALTYAGSLATLGWWFAALVVLLAQLVVGTSRILAVGLATLVAAFLLRGLGDLHRTWLVWLSPIGWAEQARSFDDPRWWPILLLVGTAAGLAAGALLAVHHRDLGAGVLAARPGPVRGPALASTFGAAVRRHRGPAAGWAMIAAVVGLAFGSTVDVLQGVTADNQALRDALGAHLDGLLVMFVALIVGGYTITAVGTLRAIERAGLLEPVLAGPTGRLSWLRTQTLVIGLATGIVALVGGVALGVGAAVATSDSGAVLRLAVATLDYLPAVAVPAALAAALFGIAPRSIALAWVALAWTIVVALLGDALRLPGAVRDTAPMHWIGRVPDQAVSIPGVLAAALLVAVGLAVSIAGFRRRDIPTP